MKYKLPNDHILIKLLPAEEKKTKSGIVIQGAGIEASATVGTVLAIGPGKYAGEILIPVAVAVGDTVYFNTKAAMHWSPELDEDYYIIQEKDMYSYISNS